MSMKHSSDTIWNRTSDLPICSAVPYPLCYRGPLMHHQNTQFRNADHNLTCAILFFFAVALSKRLTLSKANTPKLFARSPANEISDTRNQ